MKKKIAVEPIRYDDNRGPEMLSAVFVICACSIFWVLIGFSVGRWSKSVPKPVYAQEVVKSSCSDEPCDCGQYISTINRAGMELMLGHTKKAAEILGVREVER